MMRIRPMEMLLMMPARRTQTHGPSIHVSAVQHLP
jgi:hypothetical protein